MQTPAQQTEQLYISGVREYLKGDFFSEEDKTYAKARLSGIETVLKTVFGYTQERVKELINQARNA